MHLYQRYATDSNAEISGVDLDFGDGVVITVARAGGSNNRFRSVLDAKKRPHKIQIDRKSLPEETSIRILAETYAETVVLGWKGVTDADGNPLPFSKANVVKLFCDLPEFFAEVQGLAAEAASFRRQGLEDDAGNSSNTSATG